MRIFGLMGDSHTAPQDTMVAYWAALGANADGIAVGVRLTRDNEVVCISHDCLGATCGDPRLVSQVEAEVIAGTDAGVTFRSVALDANDQPIVNLNGRDRPWRGGLKSKLAISHPTLKEVLRTFARRTNIAIVLPVDFPDTQLWRLAEAVVGLCRACGVEDHITLVAPMGVCKRLRDEAFAIPRVMVASSGRSLQSNVDTALMCGAEGLLVDLDTSAEALQSMSDHQGMGIPLWLMSSLSPFALRPDNVVELSRMPWVHAVLVRSPLAAVARRDARSLVDNDTFAKGIDKARWSAGYSSVNTDTKIKARKGLRIKIKGGGVYSGAAAVTRTPIHGRFDCDVSFKVANPSNGTTFELAAIGIDPPKYSQTDNKNLVKRDVNLTFDVHGAPPYASSERDEDDGYRCGWNNSHNFAMVDEDWTAKSANMFNQYGRNIGNGSRSNKKGRLRLVRNGPVFVSYYTDKHNDGWVCSGTMLVSNLSEDAYIRLAAKHWPKGGDVPPANEVVFKDFNLYQFRPDIPPVSTVQAMPTDNTPTRTNGDEKK